MITPLSKLTRGQSGSIVKVKAYADDTDEAESLGVRLAEMGLVTGEAVTVRHHGPIARDPIAVSIRGGILAIGRREADLIMVEVTSS